jgi:hypothetical protein
VNRTRPSSRRGFTAIRLRQHTPMRKEISPEPVTSGAIGRRCWSPGRSIGHADPEHGEGLQEPGLGEGTGVDRLEAEILRQDRDRLLGRGVVATEEQARPLILEALLLGGRGCEGSRPRARSSSVHEPPGTERRRTSDRVTRTIRALGSPARRCYGGWRWVFWRVCPPGDPESRRRVRRTTTTATAATMNGRTKAGRAWRPGSGGVRAVGPSSRLPRPLADLGADPDPRARSSAPAIPNPLP